MLLLEHDALLLPGKAKPAGSLPADPKDEMFLACALEGQADLILSGDHHLLELGSWQNIPIITTRQFVERLGQPHPFIHQQLVGVIGRPQFVDYGYDLTTSTGGAGG